MKKTFFASDFHLGADARLTSAERERQIVRWLDQIAPEAEAIYLVGDLFEFWFEYNSVVPKGFNRFLGKLAEIRDANIPVFVFTGNHDLWMFGYFEQEFDIPVYRQPIQREILGKTFFIGHGDGLGPNDLGYKRMKKVFTHPFSQGLFSWLHPDMGTGLAHFFFQKKAALRPHRPNVSGWATKRNGCCNTPNANWSAASNRTILFSVTATCPSTGYYPTAAAATSISANGCGPIPTPFSTAKNWKFAFLKTRTGKS